MAAVPSIGRATRVERPVTPGAVAAGELYERYSAQIFGYCLHQLGSREEAEDAVQTTFMNAFRGLQRGVVPELESAWLFKIAHNVCLSRRRSSWRRGKVEAPNNFEVLQEVVPGREQIADELIRLPDVLEEMPENQRRAILLREWQGLTYREISAELGVSQAAVETLIFRARRALAQGLEQDADTSWKRRLRRGADAGGAVACIKALLSGGGAAALKAGATVMAVATATVATASAPTPKQSHRLPAKRAATTAHVTRHVALTPHAATATSAPTPHRARAAQPRSSGRSLPKPVALPGSKPEEITNAPAATPPASEASTPAPTATPAPAPAAAETQIAPPPADTSHVRDEEKDKSDRHPQSTTPAPAEPVPTPPAAERVEPIAQPDPTPSAHENADRSDRSDEQPDNSGKSDKRDKPDTGNGQRNGKK